MKKFYASYGKTYSRDEKTGETVFSVYVRDESLIRNMFGSISCRGVIPRFPPGLPLYIEAEEEKYINYGIEKYSYAVKRCDITDGDRAASLSFLSGPLFKGIGPSAAEKIFEAAEGRIFEAVRKPDFDQVLMDSGLTRAQAVSFTALVKSFLDKTDVVYYTTARGGSYQDAENIYKVLGPAYREHLEENPFAMQVFGLPYSVMEKTAKEQGFLSFDKRRLTALIFEAVRRSEGGGNTACTFHELMEEIRDIEDRANMGYRTLPIYIASCLVSSPGLFALKVFDGSTYIYRKRICDAESSAAEDIRRLLNTRIPLVDDVSSEDIREDVEFLGSEKNGILSLIRETGLCILHGGPGTGKTTTVNIIIRIILSCVPGCKICLCAPTASAAKRLREKTGMNAQTIHKTLGIRPCGDRFQCKDQYDQLDHDVIIVDEASMIGTELMALLLRAVKNGSLVMLVGDTNQYPSIDPGNVLYDLIKYGIRSFELTKRHRQEGSPVIVENSGRILAGRTDLKLTGDYEMIRTDTDRETADECIRLMKEHYDAKHPWDTRMFIPVRNEKYMVSTTQLNRVFHDMFADSRAPHVTYGGTVFSVGDPVTFTRNNYDGGYINGDEGVVVSVSGSRMSVMNTEGELVEVSGAVFADVELAYCITAYKSQGGECDTGIIVMPLSPASMLERTLPYVTTTRARRKNILVTQKNAFELSVRNDRKGVRRTGLSYMLKAPRAGMPAVWQEGEM